MHINLAVVRGTLSADPASRELPGGSVVVQFDVTTSIEFEGRSITQSVPIAWYDPARSALEPLAAGSEVVIVGTVRRRFFRVGGATQSRTEVVADAIVPARRRKQIAALLQETADRLLT